MVKAYRDILDQHGLLDKAKGPRPKEAPVGGPSQEHTDEHFAHAFDGSLARAQLALLDPKNEVPRASSTLLRFLSGGQVSLADVPCGAGAGVLSLLTTIAELRERGILPRLPLSVHIIGGEISAPAREYALKLLESLVDELAIQAITISYELMHWDVLDPMSNASLVERIIISKNSNPQTLLLICNFTGFLERAGKRDEAQKQIEELLKYCSGSTNAAVWIEPKLKATLESLFPWLKKKIKQWKAFVNIYGNDEEGDQTSEANFSIPLCLPETAMVRLCVLPLNLTKAI